MNHTGLSSAEVAQRTSEGRTNATTRATTRTYRGIVISNLFSVFNLAVFAAAFLLLTLFFVFQDIRTLYDSLSISTVAILNTVISIVQEIRAKRALDKIVAMSRNTSTVIRDGKAQDIPTDDIVVDDLIQLRRGDQVPVDGTIIESHHCEVDESLLTGESEYIFKEEGSQALSGSFCVAGHGVLQAEKVGHDSYIQQLSSQVRSYKRFVSPLQQKIDRIVQVLMLLALLMALLVVGQEVVGHTLKNVPANIIEATRSVASIVTSMIPVGLILLSTVAFALGVFRISQRGALIQKLNAVESFANVDVICMDKTGTLTQNLIKLSEVTPIGSHKESEVRDWLSLFAHNTSEQNATVVAITEGLDALEPIEVTDEVPFNSKDKFSGLTYTEDGQGRHLIFGALEKLGPMLSEQEREQAESIVASKMGLRTLLFAQLPNVEGTLAETMEQSPSLKGLAIVSLVDEIRPNIGEVLQQFQDRDIELKLITGDAAATARAVAEAANWKGDTSHVITGPELDKMGPEAIAQAAANCSIFARVSPNNKKDLIAALQHQGHYVAMVGDGVNDVLALKQAELGVAMGSGNRMSRDVSDIVLLDDDFTIMPEVFSEGETIISNIQASAKLFLTKNANAVFAILFAGFLGLAFPFVPRHVTIIGFFSISVPALLLTFSNRIRYVAPNFLRDVLRYAAVSGAYIAVSGLLAFMASRILFQQSVEVARTALLTQLVLLSILNFLIIVGQNKFRHYLGENKPLVGFALGFIALYFGLLWSTTQIPFLAPLARFLELHPLTSGDILTAAILAPLMGVGMLLTHRYLIHQDEVEDEG